jgi:hypothetical protein
MIKVQPPAVQRFLRAHDFVAVVIRADGTVGASQNPARINAQAAFWTGRGEAVRILRRLEATKSTDIVAAARELRVPLAPYETIIKQAVKYANRMGGS